MAAECSEVPALQSFKQAVAVKNSCVGLKFLKGQSEGSVLAENARAYDFISDLVRETSRTSVLQAKLFGRCTAVDSWVWHKFPERQQRMLA